MSFDCEICSLDEHVKFRYATKALFNEHLRLVHNIELGEDGRSLKDNYEKPEKPENPVVQVPPRR